MKKKYVDILLIAVAVLLNACSSDDAGVQTDTTGNESAGKVVQLVSYVSPFAEKELSHRAAPTGFSAYTPDKATSMGIYMLLSEDPSTDWASPKEEIIRYNTTTSKWQSNFEVAADKTYTVYGYMPKTEGMTSSLTKTTADASTLTITGMKAITTDDICIITGVKESDDGLKEGQFSWNTPTTGNQTFYINILMDHLYASVQFSMIIDADYASLRTIKLKTMTLSTNKESVDATISLTHNTTGASPITVTYKPSGSSSTTEIFNNEEGTALDKDTPVDINACFAPTLSNNLTLVTTYDVYDSKGNLIRLNSTATNKLPNLDAVRGQRVQVNMTVNPTYLYVLSDPDLDNPTITIN